MSYSSKSYSSSSEPTSPECSPLSSSGTSSYPLGPPWRRRMRCCYRTTDSCPTSPPFKLRRSLTADILSLDRSFPSFLGLLFVLALVTHFLPVPLAPAVPIDLPRPVSAFLQPTETRMRNTDVVKEIRKWKDPDFARNKLKVFYYDLPDRFNRRLVQQSHDDPPAIRDPYCDESFYSAEHTIAEFFRTGPVRTMDASEADYFYIPVLTTCYLMTHLPNNVNKTGAFFREAMDIVMQEYPYWNRSDGRDHIFTFAQGFGARLAGEWERYRHATFLVHNGDYDEDHFDTHKDIVVPPDLSHYFTPVGLSHPGTLLKKNNFVLFGGQILNTSISDHRGSNYSGGVRQYIQSDLASLDGYKVTGVRSTTYIRDMMQSVFCLAPHGWHKWSPRPAYAVLLGCIPVVISEKQKIFLEDLIDYDKISYWIRPDEIRDLDKKLRSIGHHELAQKEIAMREVWPLFWYGQKGLAEQAIMYSLHRKLGSSRPVRPYI